jgi:hypothetical protein
LSHTFEVFASQYHVGTRYTVSGYPQVHRYSSKYLLPRYTVSGYLGYCESTVIG